MHLRLRFFLLVLCFGCTKNLSAHSTTFSACYCNNIYLAAYSDLLSSDYDFFTQSDILQLLRGINRTHPNNKILVFIDFQGDLAGFPAIGYDALIIPKADGTFAGFDFFDGKKSHNFRDYGLDSGLVIAYVCHNRKADLRSIKNLIVYADRYPDSIKKYQQKPDSENKYFYYFASIAYTSTNAIRYGNYATPLHSFSLKSILHLQNIFWAFRATKYYFRPIDMVRAGRISNFALFTNRLLIFDELGRLARDANRGGLRFLATSRWLP